MEKKIKTVKQKVEKYPAFIAACLDLGLPMPQCECNEGELLFADPHRDWRTDYYFYNEYNGMKLAVEIEGGIYKNGAHNRASGFLKNVQKYNSYAMLGYTLLRFTTQQAQEQPIICARWIKATLYEVPDLQLMEMSDVEKREGVRIRKRRKTKTLAEKSTGQKVTPKRKPTKTSIAAQNQLWQDLHDQQNKKP